MSLASLTVDLTLGLAQFESDSGKAAQIIARDQGTMTASASSFEAALIRQATAAGKTSAELQIIKGATLGVSDATLDLIAGANGAGSAFTSAGTAGVDAFGSVSAAASGAASQTNSLLSTMVAKIKDVNAQASALRGQAIQQNQTGALPDDGLKAKLADIAAVRAATLQNLSVQYSADKAAAAAAVEDIADSAERKAAAQKIIDVQNGLTATYRTQLAALKELRDAGNLSPAQFKTAATTLVSAQPAVKARTDTQAATAAAAAAAAADEADATKRLGEGAALSSVQLQSLEHSVRSVFDAISSGADPIKAVSVEFSKLSGEFGSGTAGVNALLSVFTPLRLALGASAAVVAVLGYSFIEGQKQSKTFADSIVLTGGAAGVTEGQFNALAKAAAASGQVTVGSARDYGQALISTGQIAPQALASAIAAATKYGQATGQNAKDVAQDFASMGEDVLAYVTKHNAQLNLLSAAQVDQIRLLQEQGQTAQASAIYFDALNTRLSNLQDNIGALGKVLQYAKNTWSSFWDAAFDIGRSQTIEDKIAKLKDSISKAQGAGPVSAKLTVGGDAGPTFEDVTGDNRSVSDQQGEESELERIKIAQDNATAQIAETAAVTQRVVAGRALADQYAKEGKSVDLYNEKLAALKQYFADSAAVGAPVPASKQAAELKGLADSFSDKKGLTEADAQRKALLTQDLKFTTDNLQKQQDILKFNEQFAEGIYAQGTTSLEAYYDQREKTVAAGVQAELNALTDEQARLEVELAKGNFKDPHEQIQVQTQLNDAIAKAAQVQLDADHAATISLQQRTAATKALQDQNVEFAASLLQLQGNDAGAAQLRTQQQLAAAQLQANKSQGGPAAISPEVLNQYRLVLQQANALAEAQRQIGFATADATRAEDLFTTLAVKGGASLAEQDAGVYAIRQQLVTQLGLYAVQTKAVSDAEIAAAANAGRVADPKILTTASDAALAYVKALNTVDPALTRLQDAGKSLGTSLADDLGKAITTATSLKDLTRTLGKDIQASLVSAFVTKPLEAKIQGSIQTFISGDSSLAGVLKGAIGANGGTQAAQTGAIQASTSALVAFQQAINAATVAAGGTPGSNTTLATIFQPAAASAPSAASLVAPDGTVPSVGGIDAKDLGGLFDPVATQAKTSASAFGTAIDGLAAKTASAGASLGGLPGVVGKLATSLYSLITASSGSSGVSSSGGLGGLFSGLFGTSSTAAAGASSTIAGNDIALAFHTGGIVGSGGAERSVPTGIFAGAVRYHSGGIAGLAPDEVPAILRKREEVLRSDDPRHRDNGGLTKANTPVQQIVVQVQGAPNMNRDTATQQGAQIGTGIQRSLARNT